MVKKIFYTFIGIFSIFLSVWASWPEVVCNWLPGCKADTIWETTKEVASNNFFGFLWNAISEWIKYVALLAVVALIIAWIMYLMSGWDDEKVKKAKNAIIWSLVWVLLSTSAWMIINMLNAFKIN